MPTNERSTLLLSKLLPTHVLQIICLNKMAEIAKKVKQDATSYRRRIFLIWFMAVRRISLAVSGSTPACFANTFTSTSLSALILGSARAINLFNFANPSFLSEDFSGSNALAYGCNSGRLLYSFAKSVRIGKCMRISGSAGYPRSSSTVSCSSHSFCCRRPVHPCLNVPRSLPPG